MINPMQFNTIESKHDNILGNINLGFMKQSIGNEPTIDEPKIVKTRKKKLENGDDIFVPVREMETPMAYSNMPYENTYEETNTLLKSTIIQVDIVSSEVKKDLDDIRASRTLKKKYDYIPAMSASLAGLLNTKLNAIKEMNDSITNSHNLNLKRVKEVKIAEAASKGDDDKYIMDMYSAFINAPISGGRSQLGIPMTEAIMMNPTENIIRANIGNSNDYDAGYENYVRNMSPEQRMMRYENDPNIKTVIVYNQSTGARYFDVVDLRTNQSVPGTPKPDAMFLENITIDIKNNIARDVNLNKTYPLIIMGAIQDMY